MPCPAAGKFSGYTGKRVRLTRLGPVQCKMWDPAHKFSDINV